ncbi:cupin domain-containing protein [Pectobacteriaceae bacterium CE70]|uniref:DUF861 domain-containing protein n=1 Tax=Serratia sp. (strain ATCC 39006) TaxID=104623 RepID=A0A2I5TPC1_SERS3|nr:MULTISPECIES: cupin domain-containing protein [Enterobacterales]WJV59024.1 cupin domain-containing protein [Pectobacteriaceae bacterium C111]WJV63304.1 cupin domain-containing protein [Pectobacteriaceae bacterium C52]WJV67673.1 cupin domain-containing protein [Pectobacteriaceae bacterium CE70]WJY11616.1 cupin domain-containing protein [Pectobacteriaceae bacterium C80]WJY14333.1 cupin domain-containing protein [Pectobacteriaceae bacterium CE90]
MSLTAIKHDLTLQDLDSWGKFSAIGAEDLGGDVDAFGRMTLGAPTDPVSAGYFGTPHGTYRLRYPFTEQATLLSGEIIMTNEDTGDVFHFKSGDSWLITQGTTTKWQVVSQSFVKHYLAIVTD